MAMINLKSRLAAAGALALCMLSGGVLARGSEETINFLPRNEDMRTIYKDYPSGSPKKLRELSCDAGEALFNEYITCNDCVNNIKAKCPDCCLILNRQRREIRCSPDYDDRYRCCQMPFVDQGCPELNSPAPPEADWDVICASENSIASENHYQNRGCASLEPDGECRWDGENWLCEESNLRPNFRGCRCRTLEGGQSWCPAGATSENNECGERCNLSHYYITEPYFSPNCPRHGSCYRYAPTPAFASCINKCRDYADAWDTCNNRLRCCERSVCSELETPGYENCDLSACEERVNNTLCDSYTSGDCARLMAEYSACLAGGFQAGACSNCFREIDSSFNYRFVAKSGESMVIIWQMSTRPYDITDPENPSEVSNSGTYFFTKIAVFETSVDGAETAKIHESMVHQKSLEAAFSIFCATEIPSGVLKTGRSYVVKLYYFLPQLTDMEVEVEVNSMSLIIVRTRQ